ncbi:MAG: FAD:protein FMN transferase [Planctomycetia bacterium]|nr:FAD:protein FMN transferase [Planctomycetia bacterium]
MVHRRDFLKGCFRASPLPEVVEEERPAEYVEISRHCMAAEFLIYTNAGEYGHGVEVALEALDEVTRLEKLLSYFEEESEISQINAAAGRDFVEVSPEVYGLLKQCDTIFRKTQGAFDMTATPLSEVWGFLARKGKVPEESRRLQALTLVDGGEVLWDDCRWAVRLPRCGMRISLGSIGKGFALDVAANVLEIGGVENFLFHGGNSSVLARGERRGRKDWLVGLHHPLKPGRRLREIPLRNRALGTSGSATQFFWWQGKRYGHVLDPRTGFPAEGVLSVTVLAPTATEADALATAFYVMGVEATEEFCKNRPDLGVIFALPTPCGEPELKSFGNL